jgi:hypothetical protein
MDNKTPILRVVKTTYKDSGIATTLYEYLYKILCMIISGVEKS